MLVSLEHAVEVPELRGGPKQHNGVYHISEKGKEKKKTWRRLGGGRRELLTCCDILKVFCPLDAGLFVPQPPPHLVPALSLLDPQYCGTAPQILHYRLENSPALSAQCLDDFQTAGPVRGQEEEVRGSHLGQAVQTAVVDEGESALELQGARAEGCWPSVHFQSSPKSPVAST